MTRSIMKNTMHGAKETTISIGLALKKIKVSSRINKHRVHQWLGQAITPLEQATKVSTRNKYSLNNVDLYIYCLRITIFRTVGVTTTGWLNLKWIVLIQRMDGLKSSLIC